jgi:hypothetical protein
MKKSVSELCDIFKISRSKMYVIIGRNEFQKFYVDKISKTQYYDLNEESEAIIRKWAKRRTRKNGTHEIQDRGLMAKVKIKELCEKYGYSYTTMNVILSRGEFDKYRDVQGRLIIWNDEAEQRFLKIMELKEGRTIYGYSGGASI